MSSSQETENQYYRQEKGHGGLPLPVTSLNAIWFKESFRDDSVRSLLSSEEFVVHKCTRILRENHSCNCFRVEVRVRYLT